MECGFYFLIRFLGYSRPAVPILSGSMDGGGGWFGSRNLNLTHAQMKLCTPIHYFHSPVPNRPWTCTGPWTRGLETPDLDKTSVRETYAEEAFQKHFQGILSTVDAVMGNQSY